MSNLPLFDPFKALAEARRKAAGDQPEQLPQKLPQTPAGENPVSNQSLKATSAASAASAGSDAHNCSRTCPRKEEEEGKTLIISYTYARGEGGRADALEHVHATPAEAAEAAEVLLNRCGETIIGKSGPAEVLELGLREWRAGLESLSAERAPCPGYRGEEWPRTLARALAFLDAFGEQAEALGWTAPRLFGVHPLAGIVRVDACGALVLPIAGPVRAITATDVAFGHLTHRSKPGQSYGIPIWGLGR